MCRAWPWLHRPGALSAEGVDKRSPTHEGRVCAAGRWLCHETPDRTGDDRARLPRTRSKVTQRLLQQFCASGVAGLTAVFLAIVGSGEGVGVPCGQHDG